MYPTLLKFGNFEITTFGFMMFLGFMIGGLVLGRQFRRAGLGDELASSVVLAAAVGGIVGAKVYYAILFRSLDALWSRGGLVWYGGFIGGFLAVTWVVHRARVSWLRVADAVAPALALGYCLGRIGCFLVGDDYGRPTDSWLGIAFPKGLPPTTADSLRGFGVAVDPALPGETLLRVHPTQLYEAGASLIFFGILLWVASRWKVPGRVFGLFMILAGVERFLVEILRAKDDRFFGPLTVAQVISVVLVLGGAWVMSLKAEARDA
ncbi:MAG: prolipoprotein diacylglyceryl transferase [Thermoanaerobaculia bacterium]|jgi:phosphatidylglycerol:prolipoprotein diacylglycerol transferase